MLETPTPFTPFLAEQIHDSSQYASKDLNCLILSIQKFRLLTVFFSIVVETKNFPPELTSPYFACLSVFLLFNLNVLTN